jgi:hypothetical protein
MPTRSSNRSQSTTDAELAREAAVEMTPPPTKPRAARGTRTKKAATRKPPYVLLPVLVVDETLA